MKRIRKERKVEEVKQEKYMKSEQVDGEEAKRQPEHETKGNYGTDY